MFCQDYWFLDYVLEELENLISDNKIAMKRLEEYKRLLEKKESEEKTMHELEKQLKMRNVTNHRLLHQQLLKFRGGECPKLVFTGIYLIFLKHRVYVLFFSF